MEVRKNFYLIFKEAVNNAVKYSSCSKLLVEITRDNNSIEMTIKDNGSGFEINHHRAGNGMLNMKNRAKDMHGALSFESRPNAGTKITLYFKIP